jgi:hypothetical protein
MPLRTHNHRVRPRPQPDTTGRHTALEPNTSPSTYGAQSSNSPSSTVTVTRNAAAPSRTVHGPAPSRRQ